MIRYIGMYQRHKFPGSAAGPDSDVPLNPLELFAIVKRRWRYFIIPAILISVPGAIAVAVWPANYFAAGKILVESQQIPTDLVRPTVAALAGERIQAIQQRIMTRDNLLAIAKKYDIVSGWRARLSGTELVDFMRDRIEIKPLDLLVPVRQSRAQTIAFSVGFNYENAGVATRVANELVTMILNEDVRTRTNFASETTRFLERETRKIEADLNTVEIKIVEIRRRDMLGLPRKDIPPGQAQLAALKAEYAQKVAIYAESHPDVRSLKTRIAALEKSLGPVAQEADASGPEVGLDVLERQREVLQAELEKANLKLSAARQGESLERSQQSERLEVIEQPSVPQKPVSPNRPKLLVLVIGLALAAGAGLVVVMEMFDSTIRRKADLVQLIDADLLVSIPYITTDAELAWQRRRNKIVMASLALALLVAIGVALVVLPLDDIVARVTARFG